MPLTSLILYLIIIGVALWVVNTLIPMDQKIRSVINAIVILVVCLWLLEAVGLFGPVLRVR